MFVCELGYGIMSWNRNQAKTKPLKNNRCVEIWLTILVYVADIGKHFFMQKWIVFKKKQIVLLYHDPVSMNYYNYQYSSVY